MRIADTYGAWFDAGQWMNNVAGTMLTRSQEHSISDSRISSKGTSTSLSAQEIYLKECAL